MADESPPPPPPHGNPPKSSGLPPGNYDIFIIPPHASGSGFLYLPSLQPNVNSFVAGFASALILVALTFILKPLLHSLKGGGGPATVILMFAIGLGAWALGRMQSNGESRPGPSQGPRVPPHGGSYSGANNNTYSNGSASGGGPRASGTGFSPGSTPEGAGGPQPNSQTGSGTRQRTNSGWEETPPSSPDAGPEMPGATPRESPGTTPSANNDIRSKQNASRTTWEEARERTRKKEEERKKAEAERKRKEDLEKRLKELRAKEALERANRERKQREAREAKERMEREIREAKERRDREELEAREKREKAAREKEREENERIARLEREDQVARERKAKEEREIRERIQAEAEAKARADYDRRLREEIARREVLRKEEEAIRREQEMLRLEAIARVEADKKARAEKERADAEAKAKAEKAKAAAKAWADAKAAAIAKREAKAREEREKEVAAQIREVKLKEEREKAAEIAAQMREDKFREERERAAQIEAQMREATLKEEREKAAQVAAQIREAKLKEEREKAARIEAALAAERRKPSTYANAGVGERISPWPTGRPPTTTPAFPTTTSIPRPQAQPLSPKRTPAPAARTYAGTDKDGQFHSSYAQPPRPSRKKSLNSLYSESSYAASQSTCKTTPPPSTRGAYSTKDPDKIVIKGVFAFNNAFHKNPTSQLLSGVGSVTDGLILRITTEGLFIDDDVRGVAQREWDIKAWTMKLVEVWCPSFRQASRVPPATTAHKNPVRRLWGLDKELAASEEEKDTLLTGESKTAGLHILRASIRDQEGKKYVFVVQESEAWKVALGLQRLRRGTQVRSLGVSGMSPNDAKATLENLGWI
ncbi:hypothetical protein SS1G_07166 [Sclerotinia sclerotiorum 1980 UF-70]|uniref:Uncharacterized protein n=1 Tax=Sclerotinia sclerotiorum (strain ATCC 18683 / 1980 / Ss-1) TaxID=665079 RepID=A7EPB7_SCLS1|nr:hypothetical protein SS1G_07166 [Sclerotinia sclerotiorum 1980 UF-70]EDO04683.1 hypothetical protein SS1G_07166 [Sclerotinia sclerotiorum 1980 UF-70]